MISWMFDGQGHQVKKKRDFHDYLIWLTWYKTLAYGVTREVRECWGIKISRILT